MVQTIILVGAGLFVFAGIVMVLLRSRQTDLSDSVPQNVLTRINSEYRDAR